MKNFKKLSTYSAALLMFVSMGAVVAEEGDMTRTRTQIQAHEYSGDSSQAQKSVQNKNQYNYRNNYQTQQPSTSSGSMSGQKNGSRSGGGGRR